MCMGKSSRNCWRETPDSPQRHKVQHKEPPRGHNLTSSLCGPLCDLRAFVVKLFLIEITNLAVRQGKFALAGIALAVPAGCYGVLMGKSGGGKTTILEAIAGLRRVEAGTISLAGRDVTHLR